MSGRTTMTREDLVFAPGVADDLIERLAGERPPVAVAAAACALAAMAHLAGCGAEPAYSLFKMYYERLDAIGASDGAVVSS